MMNIKKLSEMTIVAICGGLVAIFAYTKVLDSKESPYSAKWGYGQQASHILASFEPFNARDVSYPDLTLAAERTINCVVHVRVKSMQPVRNPLSEFFGGGQNRQQVPQEGFGSGVILSPDGYIVTNSHVIRGANEIEVKLNDGRVYTATIVGADPATDLALLKISETDLPFIVFGDSDALRVGEWVLAVGNPLNLTSTVTAGIVSAKGRHLGVGNQRAPIEIESFIQTDAAINRGNSGGALVNTRGELLGINTLIMSQAEGFTGNAFAIPTSIVEKVVTDLKAHGAVQRAYLGVTFRGSEDRFANDNEDLTIVVLTENGGAAAAGIKLGDRVTSFNDVPVKTFAEFQGQISRYRPSDKVKISVIRDNKTQHFDVVLRNIDGTTNIVRPEVAVQEIVILGATFEELPQSEKQRLNITSGVRVREVGQGRFSSAGVRNGFIITSVNDKSVNSVNDIKEVIDAVEPRGRIVINGVSRRGEVSFFAFAK